MFRRPKPRAEHRECQRETDDVRRARERAEQAERQRKRVQAREPQTKQISTVLREAIERNHFGESIVTALSLRRDSP